MMPERERLAVNLFETVSLRSPTGLAVICDLLALYEREKEVGFRPGLEPDKCCCLGEDDCSKLNLGNRPDSYDWKHIYNCYKTKHEKKNSQSERGMKPLSLKQRIRGPSPIHLSRSCRRKSPCPLDSQIKPGYHQVIIINESIHQD
jgi:hypothetical protein